MDVGAVLVAALKHDLKVLLVGAIILFALIFVIGLFKIILIGGILLAGYFLLRIMRSEKEVPKTEPPKV